MLHDRIRKRREQKGISIDDVADALGVSRTTVYRYEHAKITKISTETAEKLAAILQTSVDYLTGKTDDPDFVVVDLKESFQNIDDYTDTYHKAISKSEEAAPPSMDAEMQMLTFLYGALSKENKMKIVEAMQLMLLRQKGMMSNDD